MEKRLNGYISDWEEIYGLSSDSDSLDLGGRFIKVLEAAHKKTGHRAVVLIDEYDKPILDVLDINSRCDQILASKCIQRFQPT